MTANLRAEVVTEPTAEAGATPGRTPAAGGMPVALYATGSFVASGLIFVLEPMFGKMLLPVLGGTPAVWITCVLFFQCTMLLGYAYAHWSAKKLRPHRQASLHLLLLACAVAFLPIGLPARWRPPVEHNPALWVLAVCSVAIGIPFTLLCTMAPTLQRWFAALGHDQSHDPYFLYSASNAGSMLGLLAYPLLIEPSLTLKAQSRFWTVAYGIFVLFTAACVFLLWRVRPRDPGLSELSSTAAKPIALSEALRWVALAAVPSSLMLGLTTYLATDIPPVPLLFVLPLAVYLATFILAFARREFISHDLLVRRMPFIVLITTITMFLRVTGPLAFLVLLHVVTFFVLAMVCHGELARRRPAAGHLTAFYLCISLGGVVGGVFNAILAPLLFHNVLEYPLALVAALLLRPRRTGEGRQGWRDVAWPVGLAAVMVTLGAIARAANLPAGRLTNLLVVVPAALVCLSFSRRRVRFALGIAAIFACAFYNPFAHVLYANRSFFGVSRVVDDPSRQLHLFMHGTTLHGAQSVDPARHLQMLAYFSPAGPLGEVFSAVNAHEELPRVGVLGLGAGTLACYGRPHQDFTYYEIDPVVERIARDPRYFTFLRDCPPKVSVVLGDGRLSLARERREFDLLVVDTFSSDVVPVHLLTREALALYLARLAPHGVIAINISNRYLDLRSVVGNLARDAGLMCLHREEVGLTPEDVRGGRMASHWVVLAHSGEDLGTLATAGRWQQLAGEPGARVWSDDFSNILSVIRLK